MNIGIVGAFEIAWFGAKHYRNHYKGYNFTSLCNGILLFLSTANNRVEWLIKTTKFENRCNHDINDTIYFLLCGQSFWCIEFNISSLEEFDYYQSIHPSKETPEY